MNKLINGLKIVSVRGNVPDKVSGIATDSRKVRRNFLFVAVKGQTVDGHLFIEKSVELGCSMVVCEILPETIHDDVAYVQVKDSATAAGIIASNYHDNPSQKLQLVGVTGTNGKTTTATLLYNLFTSLGYCCGLLSTVKNIVGTTELPTDHTTPDPITINMLLSQMVRSGCAYCFMEVSSHAADQQRIAGLTFAGGIFSNITHDHLDYHKTFVNYIAAKKKFFNQLPTNAFALTNADDKNGMVMVENTQAKVYTYGIKEAADFHCNILEMSMLGSLVTINNEAEFMMPLPGVFNVYNQLSVYAAALLLKGDKDEVKRVLSGIKGAEGRFQIVPNKANLSVIIDYAHTPDALANLLKTARDLVCGNGKIICVFGAGGDRDRSKRPEMGNVATKYADLCIVTSDNPRSESPEAIINDIVSGITPQDMKKVVTMVDRKEAVKLAVKVMHDDDVLLIAGKGHEKYQEINGVKYHFDDNELVNQLLN